jgi:hypothetical protein
VGDDTAKGAYLDGAATMIRTLGTERTLALSRLVAKRPGL